MNDLVSVIIPTHNRACAVFERAFRSVLCQTYDCCEIIVVDDSHGDFFDRNKIEELCAEKQKYTVVYLKNATNLGGSLSRNRGIEAAQGRFITFLDDDDEYCPDKIREQVRFMIENDCDMSFSNMKMYNSSGKLVDFREYHKVKSYDNDSLLKYHILYHLTGTPTYMFLAQALRKIGGFDDAKIGQEYLLMLKAITQGLKIRYLDSCSVRIFKHTDGGITQGKNKIEGEKALYHKKKEYLRLLNWREILYVKFRHWVVMAVAYRRNREYTKMLGAGMLAVATSPVDFCYELCRYLKGMRILKLSKPKE